MSLEGDLLLPPRGPLKWRWLTKMLNKLATAAGLVSPDESVNITPTAGGYMLQVDRTSETNPNYNPWRVIKSGVSTYHVDGGEIKVNGSNKFPADVDLTIANNVTRIVAVKVNLDLTAAGDAVTPRFNGTFSGAELSITPATTIVAITTAELAGARSVLPGTRSDGVVYVPLALVSNGVVDQVWLKQLSRIRVDPRHCDFTISSY